MRSEQHGRHPSGPEIDEARRVDIDCRRFEAECRAEEGYFASRSSAAPLATR